jgi:hypothetical protein
LKPQRLHMWRVRGIPIVKRHAFMALASGIGVSCPSDFFEKFAA